MRICDSLFKSEAIEERKAVRRGGGGRGGGGGGGFTVRLRGMETGISEASKRVSIFSFATQGGKQVSFYFRQRNWVQAREARIRFPAS